MNAHSTRNERQWRRAFASVNKVALAAPGKSLLVMAVVIGLFIVPRLTRADNQDEQGRNDNQRHEDLRLEGSWIDTVSPILPPGVPPVTIQTYITYSKGGVSIGSDRSKPFASPQFGTWVHVQGDEYAGTFVQDLFDQAGTFLGTFKGRWRIRLIGKDEYLGVANVEQRDPAGNIQLNRCARFSGARIVVEPGAPMRGIGAWDVANLGLQNFAANFSANVAEKSAIPLKVCGKVCAKVRSSDKL